MVTTALAAHGEVLAGQQVAKMVLALGDDIVEVTQRVFLYLQEMGNTRGAGEALDHLALDFLVFDAGNHFEVVPHT
ncbi:hypothetical protein, partial [Acinetobacter nosocomialis]|uniref:hypothetical protein n=1 Tax=Acinetobacter nosocomialis TaxID=106654 RepID=UPI00403A1CC3